MVDGSDAFLHLVQSAASGDQTALGEVLDRNRGRLRRLLRLRMDRRVRGRIDPSDVIQETFVEAARRLGEYVANPAVPFFVWLRYLAIQRLQLLHRHHLGTQARDVRRDVSLHTEDSADVESEILATGLLAQLTSPSMAAARAELKSRLLEALNAMERTDREILAMRHFEQLSNSEAAQVLGITPTAACNRYVRALERFRPIAPELSIDAAEISA